MHLIACPRYAKGEVGDTQIHRLELRRHWGVAATRTNLLIVEVPHPPTLPSLTARGVPKFRASVASKWDKSLASRHVSRSSTSVVRDNDPAIKSLREFSRDGHVLEENASNSQEHIFLAARTKITSPLPTGDFNRVSPY
jgi:hypothetical protein